MSALVAGAASPPLKRPDAARHPPADNPPRAYIGDEPGDLFLALAPWTFPDPGDADEALSSVSSLAVEVLKAIDANRGSS